MRCASAGVTVHACGVAMAGGGSGGRGLSVAEPVRRSVEAGGGEDGGMGELVYPWDGCRGWEGWEGKDSEIECRACRVCVCQR